MGSFMSEGISRHKLPVQYSIIDAQALGRLIETLYGWSDVRCQLIKGTMRDVYAVDAYEHKAILTLYRHGERNAQEIDAELAAMLHLSEGGLYVPTPISQKNSQNIVFLLQPEGERFAVMTTFMQGSPIGRQITAAMSHRVGKLIGEAHHAFDRSLPPLHRPVLSFQEAMQRALVDIVQVAPHRKDNLAWLQPLSHQLEQSIRTLSRDNASYGLLHGDVIPSNILSHASDLVLLDFDLCAYGWRVYDVASFLVEIEWWNMGNDVRDAFLSGYSALHPMSQPEIDSLPALQAIRCVLMLGLAARHINTWGRAGFSQASIDISLAIIRNVFPF